MGNRVSCLKGKNEPSSSITLAIIGPDNAGKTTLSSILAGEPLDPHVSPTVGFRNVKFTIKKFDVTLYDLGGGKNIRPIWKNYFNEVYGVVYMVDSSSPQRLKEARDLMRDTLEHPQVSGKPLLVLANKVDVEGHMEEVDIYNQLDLDHTVNANNCPSHFVMISALQSSKAKMKKVVLGGFMWLLDTIRASMDTIEPRVKEDMRAMKEMRDREREERRERVRRQREEREKLEDAERERLGLPKRPESDCEDDIKGDPFKKLDYNKLKMKEIQEGKLKAEKKRKQQELSSGKLGSRDRSDLQRIKDEASIGLSMDDTMTLPRFGRQGPSSYGRSSELDGLDIGHSSALMLSGRNARQSALPPLEPIGSGVMASLDKKKGKKKKTAGSDALEYGDGLDSMRNGDTDLYKRSDLMLGSRSLGKQYGQDEDEYSMKMARDVNVRQSYPVSRSSYADRDSDRDLLRNVHDADSLGHLDLSHHSGSHSYSRADVHDLTPRVAKPKSSKMTKASRIEEDENEESINQYRNFRTSLKEYGDPRMSQKLDEYRDKYSLRSASDTKEYRDSYGRDSDNKYPMTSSSDTHTKDKNRRDRPLERESSLYRKSLKDISPPDLHRFEDDKDEGIEDDSDSEDLVQNSRSYYKAKQGGSYGTQGRKEKSKKKDVNANNRRTQYSEDEEDEEDTYKSKSSLKNTLRFSRHDDDDEEEIEDARRKYERDVNKLKYRRDNDYKTSYQNHAMDSDDDRLRSRTPEQVDPRRKKKKNILKSNRLAPSDDDDPREMSLSQRYSSPRLVQERGSRNTSDADTPSKGRNSRTTYFHSGSSRESELAQKWGLAEDLPTIDNDSRIRRNVRPNFDDSDGEDVVY